MIKLVGFNISGIPNRNDRDDRRDNAKRMSNEHRQSGTEKVDQDETEIGNPNKVKAKGGLVKRYRGYE
jgi:hypothetical protein